MTLIWNEAPVIYFKGTVHLVKVSKTAKKYRSDYPITFPRVGVHLDPTT